MPNRAFSEAIERSGSGYNAKLSALVGVGAAIKEGQLLKQQMQFQILQQDRQFEQQRDLIQLRADTQFDLQKRVHDEITGPTKEQQAQQKVIFYSQKSATDRVRKLREDNKQYKNLNEFGLFPVMFSVEPDVDTGLYKPVVRYQQPDGSVVELDEETYIREAESLNVAADYFRRLETGLAQGWFPEEIPDEEKVRELGDGRVVQRIDRRTANEILTAARNDRGAALMLLRDRTRFEEPHRYLGEDSGDDVSVDRSKNLATYFARVIGYMDDNGNVTFEFIEEPSRWQKWRGKIPERLRSTINLASGTRSVAEIQTDLQAISMDVFDIDLAALSRYKPDIRGQIIIGDTSGLSGDEKKIAERIKTLRSDLISEAEMDKLFNTYFNLESAVTEWRQEQTSFEWAQTPDHALIPNFGTDDPMKAFKVKDFGDPAQRAFQQTLDYRREASLRR